MNLLYILLAIFIFGILIFIHELGHFLAARRFGVPILEFAIGMGPKLFSKKSRKSGTVYSIRILPIGGFVSMLGENGMELAQGEQPEGETSEALALDPELEGRAYCNQSVWKRILISLAGPAMNVFLGFLLMLAVVLLSGHSSMGSTEIAGFYVAYTGEEEYQGFQNGDFIFSFDTTSDLDRVRSFDDFRQKVSADEDGIFTVYVSRYNSESMMSELVPLVGVALDDATVTNPNYFKMAGTEASGLRVGDKVLKVNSTSVHTAQELSYEVMNQGYRPLSLTILRNGEKQTLNITVRETTEQGVVFGELDFIVYREAKFDVGTVLKHTYFRSCSTVKMVYDSLVGLVTGRFGMEAVSGPVGITKTISQTAKTGFVNVLYLITVISINLGIMNLLPIPGLDGGHLLIYLIEAIRRKPMKRELEGLINFAGLLVMLALAVIIAIKDIITL